MHPKRGPGVPLGARPVEGAAAPAQPAPTTRAFDRLMGRQSPPLRVGPCEVLAERAVGDDVDGTFPGIVAAVEGDLVRVAYALDDGSATIVESTLHVDQVRQLIGRPPTR